MTIFDLSEPLLPTWLLPPQVDGLSAQPPSSAATQTQASRSLSIGLRDLKGLIKLHAQEQLNQLPRITLTELDQAFVVWGMVALVIFAIAQFSTISWQDQVAIDTVLTGAAIALTSSLSWEIATIADLRWVVTLWAVLMSLGMALTAYGIFGGVGFILINLCPLWLGLCALAYGIMGIGMGSWCFSACSFVHALTIAVLQQHPTWQFLISGLVMAMTLFFFSVFPWDMRDAEPDDPC